jgi:hypothetical protein
MLQNLVAQQEISMHIKLHFPKKDWITLGNEFVENVLGLQRMQFTTQIEHYDNLAAHFDTIKRINNILLICAETSGLTSAWITLNKK